MLIRLLCWCVQKLSASAALRVARAIGTIWYFLIPIRCGVARQNIERTLVAQGHIQATDVPKLAHASCRQLAM